ncbi:branched-chain amino acid ABC transporter substrate-binding protein, partial [Calderihabitans maritimus]
MYQRRKIMVSALILALMVLLTGCGSGATNSEGGQAQEEETRDYFKVGVITSLSGSEVYGGNLT